MSIPTSFHGNKVIQRVRLRDATDHALEQLTR